MEEKLLIDALERCGRDEAVSCNGCVYDGRCLHDTGAICRDALELIGKYQEELERVKRERDAAVKDARLGGHCKKCRHNTVMPECEPCNSCATLTEIDVKKLRHKNTDLVRKNGKLRKERDRLKNEIDELREKLDEAKLGLIWYSMLDKVGELIDESERLKDKTHNLTLYLRNAREYLDIMYEAINWESGSFKKAFNEDFDGMPGYNPEILEEQE